MDDIDRRSMLGLGAAATLVFPAIAAAQTYPPTAGKVLAPGVSQVDLGERDTSIAGYKKIPMRDIIIAPGAKTPEPDMMNDMLCHLTEGELLIVQNKHEFTVKQGQV
jgi:hypothetical protein